MESSKFVFSPHPPLSFPFFQNPTKVGALTVAIFMMPDERNSRNLDSPTLPVRDRGTTGRTLQSQRQGHRPLDTASDLTGPWETLTSYVTDLRHKVIGGAIFCHFQGSIRRVKS